jgi:NAD(P)-dependent dehydrogenase (short-subunit alcohol dehydrogenase family)
LALKLLVNSRCEGCDHRHNPKTLEEARRELGPDVLVFSSDASDIAGQKLLAEQVSQAFGALDALFLNAGVVDMRAIEKFDAAAFDRSLHDEIAHHQYRRVSN